MQRIMVLKSNLAFQILKFAIHFCNDVIAIELIKSHNEKNCNYLTIFLKK